MAEAAIDPQDAYVTQEAARAVDRARMKRIGSHHFAMVMASLTLWGAAQAWAQVTGWGIAQFAAIANALIAGTIIPSVIHEWGHFAGARLMGAESPVLKKPLRQYFMFDFKMDQNDANQFVWMSWGGILAPWLAVILALALVPLGLMSGAVLTATLIARAASATAFELPVVMRVNRGGDPGAELEARLKDGGLDKSGRFGKAVGVGSLLLLLMLL